MSISKLFNFGLVLCLSGLIVFLYWHTQPFNINEHERFSHDVLKLQAVNADLNKNILKVRYRLLDYYDILVSQLADMESLHTSLAVIPSAIGEDGKGEIQQAHQVIGDLLQEKSEALERFKSKNAVLKNSVRYLPAAVRESVRQLEGDKKNLKLIANLESLLQDVLEYHLAPSKDLEGKVQKRLSFLAELRPASASTIVTFNEASEHAKTILEHTPVVNSLTESLIWVPIWQWGQTLGQTYRRHHTRLVYEADSFRFYLYIAGAAFVLFTFIVILGTPNRAQPSRQTASASVVLPQEDGSVERGLPEPMLETAGITQSDNLIVTASPADPYFAQRQSGEFQIPTNS